MLSYSKYGAGALMFLAGLAGLAGIPARAQEDPRPAQRISVMVAAQDVFSRRTAELIEHLGAQRINREPGLEMVYLEELAGIAGVSESREKFASAVKHLQRGLVSYENLELDKAVNGLSGVAEQLEKLPAELLRDDKQSYNSALTFLAAAYILTGDLPAGQEAFRRLLVSDRRAKLDKTLFPPSMVSTFEGVRQEVVRGPVGNLSVVSVPSHAKVYVDRVFRGITPCTVDNLPAGKHLVVIRKGGHATWGEASVVEEGGEQQVRCMLQQLDEGQEMIEAVQKAASEIDEDEPLASDLQSRAREAGLDRLVLGNLLQRGEGVAYKLALYDVSSGKVVNLHEGTLMVGSSDFAQTADGVFSYLITGRGDVLKSNQAVATGDDQLRLKDEERFNGDEPSPFYKTWWFWTALGVGAGAITAALVLFLPTSEEPRSQILLEF